MAERVAVVGLACRIPGAETVDEFWTLLVESRDLIEPVPADRIALAEAGGWGGFVTDLDTFDPGFFGLAEAEAAEIDPQQRLLLEVAWTALEHAGHSASTLAGSNTGVYIGQTAQDAAMLGERGGPWRNPGLCHAIGANRLSYRWDLHGPSMSVDTACSASLVAVHLAVRALLGGECDLAVAGGVNVLLAPGPQTGAAEMAALAPDGRCRPFDAAASGYVRAEGAGAVVLKRLTDAVADGDPIHAVIAGSAVGQDGRTNGLTAPSGAAQQRVIRAALTGAGVTDVDYVEAHGTGTPLGDPIETAALAAALSTSTRAHPLPIGSVKANIGHLEAAAGIVGLLKAILLVNRRKLVPTPHFTTANPRCRLAELNLTVPHSGALPERPVIGVSSFGFGGTNAHVILTAPPARSIETPSWSGPVLVPISAHHPAGVARAAATLADTVADGNWSRIAAIARSLGAMREHHPYRCAVVADTADDLVANLRAVTTGRYAARARRIAFVYSGQGTRVVRPPDPALPGPSPTAAQPRIVFSQLALTAALREAGVQPDVVVGHSLGELSAAIVAGKLALPVGLRVLRHRTRVTGDAEGSGAMLAVAASRAEVEPLLTGQVWVAAENAPRSVVLSGATSDLDTVADRLRGHRMRRLRVRYPSHSPLMADAADELAALLGDVPNEPAELDFYSTVTGTDASGTVLDADYWAANLRSPVRFADTVRALLDDGVTHIVEIAPTPLLLPDLAELGIATAALSPATPLPQLLARLYEFGITPDFPDHDGRRYADLLPPTTYARKPIRTAGFATRQPEPARTESVADVLARLLGTVLPASTTPPMDVPFAELGLDSLHAVELRGRLERELGRSIPISVFWAHPTGTELALALSSEPGALDELLAVLEERA